MSNFKISFHKYHRNLTIQTVTDHAFIQIIEILLLQINHPFIHIVEIFQ